MRRLDIYDATNTSRSGIRPRFFKPMFRGWILYDGRCPLCRSGARRFGRTVQNRGFALVPLQRRWVRNKLGMDDLELLKEMRLLTADGQLIGGADAYVYISGLLWWALPLAWFSRLPGAMRLLRRIYRWIAVNRFCISGACGMR